MISKKQQKEQKKSNNSADQKLSINENYILDLQNMTYSYHESCLLYLRF